MIPRAKRSLRKFARFKFMNPNIRIEPLDIIHDSHISEAGKWLRGFSYNELFKWKRRMKRELMCSACEPHLLRIAAYLKFHIAEYPHTKRLCVEIMHKYIDLKGSEVYEEFPMWYAQRFDRLQSKTELEEYAVCDILRTMVACKKINSKGSLVGMATQELPSINCFPMFNRNKESKMYLCDLDTPNDELVTEFKSELRVLLGKYGPAMLERPVAESVKSLGPSFYSDGHVKKYDYEKPEHTWTDSFDYQKFHTSAMTQREVWLPPKGYKIVSSWWHFLLDPIMKRIPWVVSNETQSELRIATMKRMKPCRKIDLKGFGLQFPREYVIATMDILCEMYPHEELSEYRRSAIAIFKKMAIRMEDGYYVVPKRGVGLGYFSNIMTLVIAVILGRFNVIKMFNDDILIDDNDFEEGIARLEHFKFVINAKKTGMKWRSSPYFAEVLLSKKGIIRFYQYQGLKASIHTGRGHYKKKQAFLAAKFTRRWLMCYHYTRMYGYEIHKLEAFDHPTMLGLNPRADKPVGYVKGGLLRKYRAPKTTDEFDRRLWSIVYPWKDRVDNNFLEKRKNVKKFKDIVWYTEYDEYLNPEVSNARLGAYTTDIQTGKYQLPRWADMQAIFSSHVSSGRTTRGRHPKLAAYKMLDYLLSDDPIASWLTGGYEVLTNFYRRPGVEPGLHFLYHHLKMTKIGSYPVTNKVAGEGALVAIHKWSGIDFMKDITSTGEFVFTNDIIDQEQPEEDDNISLSDDVSVAVVSDNEQQDTESEYSDDGEQHWFS